MSFDVDVGDYTENYTANLGAFFAWALGSDEVDNPRDRSDSRDAIFGPVPRDGLRYLDDLTAEEACKRLTAALERIATKTRAELAKYDPENGWGNVDSATAFLRRFRDACAEADAETKVSVTW